MNNLYALKQWVPAKLFAVFTIVSLILSAFPAFVLTAEANAEHKVDICHWSDGDQSFSLLNVAKSSIGNAHGTEGSNDGDIIPPFDDYEGYNWDTEGQEIYNNDCVPPPPQEKVSPILECVEDLGQGVYRAHFGYENKNTEAIDIPVGDNNKFTGGGTSDQNQGQPTTFAYPAPDYPSDDRKGRTGFYPDNAFSVDFDGTNLVWTLKNPNSGNGGTATANSGSAACPLPDEPVKPIFECWMDNEDGTGTGYFGYINENDVSVDISVGDDNKVSGGPNGQDEGQPTTFDPGRTPYVDDAGVFKPENAAFSVEFPLAGNAVWTLTDLADKTRTATAGTGGKECPLPPPPPVCEIGENLLDNGSFEEPEVTDDKKWRYTAITDWIITALDDNAPQDGELHRGWSGNEAADGEQYAELDSRESVKMAQTVSVLEGGVYELKWAFAPRHGIGAGENQLSVSVDGSEVATEGPATLPAGLSAGDWTRNSHTFTADSDSIEIAFADAGEKSDSLGTFLDDTALCFVREPAATIVATKIVCDDESYLPDWAPNQGVPEIDENTVANFMAEDDNAEHCRLVDWDFQWAPPSASNPGDNATGVGEPWTTFTNTVEVDVEDGWNHVWVREVPDPAYIPFTGKSDNDPVSAEIYCETDSFHYDNYDRVDGIQSGETYHCVAWNVPVEKPEACTLTLVSDTDDFVVEKDDNAKELSWIHSAWTAVIDGASWIWGDDPVADPANDETQTFTKKFGWAGTVDSATLYVASDNSHKAEINGDLAGEETDEQSFRTTDQDEYDVTGLIDQGNNELSVAVKNWAGDSDPKKNPAGLLYKLEITTYDDVDCAPDWEPEPAPYCGDGEVNQLWEDCDGKDVEQGMTCTDSCQFDNQCSMEQLVKITLDDTTGESQSFDGSIHLDEAGNTIPSGTWFNFGESAGASTFVDIANAVDGLAVKRNGVDDKLELAFVGGNARTKLDIVSGSIMTLGIDLGSVDRAPNPSFKLEDGSGSSFDDVFDKVGTSIDFDLRADTGNDGVSVEIGQGEEYNCPECLATVEARVLVNSSGTAGDGDLSDEIILGDAGYTTVEFGEWFPISEATNPGDSAVMIDDPNTVTNFANAGDKPGLFVSREDGTVKVALYGEHNPGGSANNEWIDARIEVRDAQITNFMKMTGGFKFENHNGNNQPSGDYDEAIADSTGVDFKMWVDTASDGFKFDITEIDFCKDDSGDMFIDGHKFAVGEGYWPLEGWAIELHDEGGLVAATTTDENGYYWFEVPEGDYEVYEVMQSGWELSFVEQNGSPVDASYCEFEYKPQDELLKEFVALNHVPQHEGGDNHCDFYNEQDDDTPPQRLNYIDGYKFEVVGESDIPYEGWTIYASNGIDTPLSTTTDENGYYYFWVSDGEWEVYEADASGWTLVQATQDGVPLPLDQDLVSCDYEFGLFDFAYVSLQTVILDDYPQEVGCNFYNEQDEVTITTNGGGSSSGTRTRPDPQVAGASTDFCPFLEDYMQISWENDSWEVTKLQMFLNMIMGETLELDGIFGRQTDEAVKRFQTKYHSEVIAPWFERGIVPHNDPTGFVYKTTKWKINDIVCPGVEPYPSFDGEDLNSNIDED